MTEHKTTEHTLHLPHTTPPLHANQRHHWAVRAKLTRQLRDDTHILARAAKLPQGCSFATVTLHYLPTTRRRRDRHNLYPTVKACIDGLVDYGLVPDDSAVFVSAPEPVIHPANRSPRRSRLWLEIETKEVA
ncbi:hypothetical protein B842_03485 [Corynebacterium humireducens NBRC 106098 = DSM 45392]|uniref:RusA-like resolvase n=1 Tax=Corynebacterium humireducens NBRC 106098 = DSM 45392 TaxID=1223515 RepID=A0A0B5D144_9CORY|nr:hypothetical protein [Corynebacterium humireducens]AJE32550.1 hypothetical protein B842_03485 [Corynebacterium humireducens NBRC 106098 = DSM 45392]